MIPKRIILHHSAGPDNTVLDWAGIRRYHMSDKGYVDIGYHFGIEKVGETYEVLLGRMFNEPGAHCHGANYNSLGIVLIGNFELGPVPPAQFAMAVRLCKALRATLGIPTSQMFGHRELASTLCPGKYFDMDLFRREVTRV